MEQHQDIEIQIISTDDPLALTIQKKLDEVPYQSTTTKREITIFRVPSRIRERNKNFYEPSMVSIGPYHRGREDLKCMEREKMRFVVKMLSKNANVTLANYLEELRKLESAARKCYYENIEMGSDEFIEMLLYDSCFIIQLVVNWSSQDADIVNDISWNIPLLRSDLLMLENQIPFSVLQGVFNLYSNSEDHTLNIIPVFHKVPEKRSLLDLLFVFVEQQRLGTFLVREGDNPPDHLLDFYYKCFMRKQELPTNYRKNLPLNFTKLLAMQWNFLRYQIGQMFHSRRERRAIPMCIPRMIPCATELQDAGITMKKADAHTIFSVDFSHGVLRIPSLSVADETTPQIMNLRAYEQCSDQTLRPFTRYTMFLDAL